MHEREKKTVIAIVGMPGAGKSLASSVARKMGWPVYVSGDVIRAEARRRGLSPNKKNLGRLMLEIRRREGMAAVARRVIPLVQKSTSPFAIYEGARSIEEIHELKKDFEVVSIAIHASPQTRFERLLKRKRGDRPRGWKDFVERDERELRVGLGKTIALSNHMVDNQDTKEALKRRMQRLLTKIKK